MKLTRYGFDFLVLLDALGKGKYTQKQIANRLSVSVGAVNKFIKDFSELGLIACDPAGELYITEKGLKTLSPYRVKRAIVLAAGFSERLAPISLECPKPLVEINGVRLMSRCLMRSLPQK